MSPLYTDKPPSGLIYVIGACKELYTGCFRRICLLALAKIREDSIWILKRVRAQGANVPLTSVQLKRMGSATARRCVLLSMRMALRVVKKVVFAVFRNGRNGAASA